VTCFKNILPLQFFKEFCLVHEGTCQYFVIGFQLMSPRVAAATREVVCCWLAGRLVSWLVDDHGAGCSLEALPNLNPQIRM
jgi:hypothetical protein